MVVTLHDKPKLVIIVGGVREDRFGPAVTSWAAEQSGTHGACEVTVVDPADQDIPSALPDASPKYADDDHPHPGGMAELAAALDDADAFVAGTPLCNHSSPASLKAAVDGHFTRWTAKAVAFGSYGDAAGGRHAVPHLADALTEPPAVTIREGLAFPNHFTSRQERRPSAPEAAGYAKTLLDRPARWATALRPARHAEPLPA
ncbi:NAD(P)H-dependent oxidoreductase [Streptomyces sp. YIM 132580]|uniref:NAD(P)H-dependent oxidoreductase n=1 Tax=Streptomyces sp. YIM 132580 TaxID=2691958 RepID=UPI003FCED692